jgi:AbrB family looped-hinge helix DNA binding protein
MFVCAQKKSCNLYSEVNSRKTTVTARGQMVIPAKIRKAHQINISTKLEWIDDGDTIRVVPLPTDPIETAKGMSKGLFRRLMKERELERKLD